MGRPVVLVVAWESFQPRTLALGDALGGESSHIRGGWPGRHPALLPLRYLADGVRMWRMLRRQRPTSLVVISPPVIAPLVGWLWSLAHGTELVIDCHTGAFNCWKWRWTVPIHRVLFRRARAVLVHTEDDQAKVRSWGVQPLLLPDDVPDQSQASVITRPDDRPRVVVAGSFQWDEPVEAALAAAAMLPEVEFRLTGDPARLSESVRRGAPSNAIFTGFLRYPEFLGELLTADVVAVFTTDPDIMNRAAFEAIGLGRPLVLSDLPKLRARFGQAALLCGNAPEEMAEAIRCAQRDHHDLAQRSATLQRRLRAQHETAIARLASLLA